MRKLIVCLVLVGLLATLVAPAMARYKILDGQTKDVTTTATVGGGTPAGGKPIVKVVWVMPDDGDPGHDDITHPADTHTKIGTQMKIKPSETKSMETYIVATFKDPSGASSRDNLQGVYIKIWKPGQDPITDPEWKQKYADVGSNPIPTGPNDSSKPEVHEPLAEAVRTKLGAVNTSYYTSRTDPVPITQAEHDEIDNEIDKQEAYMYKISCSMNYCDPAGEYIVRAYAVCKGDGQVSDPVEVKYEWNKTRVLEIDFEGGLNFGNVSVGGKTVISGDNLMWDIDPTKADPGAVLNKPTVKNEGNCPLYIWIRHNPMTGLKGKQIIDFDVQFLTFYTEFLANADVKITDPLPLCNQKQIDFSVLPGKNSIVEADTYTGKLYIWATEAP